MVAVNKGNRKTSLPVGISILQVFGSLTGADIHDVSNLYAGIGVSLSVVTPSLGNDSQSMGVTHDQRLVNLQGCQIGGSSANVREGQSKVPMGGDPSGSELIESRGLYDIKSVEIQ